MHLGGVIVQQGLAHAQAEGSNPSFSTSLTG